MLQNLPTFLKKYNFVQLLILAFPIVIVNVKHASELIMLILAIFGIYYAIKEKTLPFFNSQLKIYSIITWVFFFSVVASSLFNENIDAGLHKIGSNIHFLLAPFVAFSIYKNIVDFKIILSIIKVSIIIAFIYGIYQYFYLHIGRVEAGADSPTLFGIIMVIYAFASIANIFNESIKNKIFSIIIFTLALFLIILSGTRISWIAFIMIIPTILFLWKIGGYLNKKRMFSILSITVLMLFVFANNNLIQNRIDNALNSINSFSSNKDTRSSSGLRLAMWNGGLQAFKDKPIFGYGYQNTGKASAQYVTGNYAKKFIASQKMLHNDYINSMVGFGIFGILSFLALLFMPLIIFIKRLKNKKYFAKNATGILLTTTLLIFAITDSIYAHSVMRSFYVFFFAILLINYTKNNYNIKK
jgi:O-antigen ligase